MDMETWAFCRETKRGIWENGSHPISISKSILCSDHHVSAAPMKLWAFHRCHCCRCHRSSVRDSWRYWLRAASLCVVWRSSQTGRERHWQKEAESVRLMIRSLFSSLFPRVHCSMFHVVMSDLSSLCCIGLCLLNMAAVGSVQVSSNKYFNGFQGKYADYWIQLHTWYHTGWFIWIESGRSVGFL